jgi:hypothetical protein
MKHVRPFLLSVVLLCCSNFIYAQAWSGILDSSRATNWQRANVGVINGIPTTWPTCTSAQAGTTVPIAAYSGTSAAITTALANCASANPSGFVLYLGSGTFTLSNGLAITTPNAILRGQGASSTTIAFSAGTSCLGGNHDVCIYNSLSMWEGNANVYPGGANAANWTGTSEGGANSYPQGASHLTVANIGSTGILNGDIIILDQPNDTSDTGGFMVCDANGEYGPYETSYSADCMSDGVSNGNVGRIFTSSGGNCISAGTKGPCIPRAQMQHVRVTAGCSSACTGSGPFTLTVSPGLYANNWGGGGSKTGTVGGPGIWFGKGISLVGVEQMTLDHSSTSASAGLTFYFCDQCWVRDIRSIKSNNQHVLTYDSSRCEIRDSYFFGTMNSVAQSYGILLAYGNSSDDLVENNIFQQITSPILGGGAGNVIAYNFSINDLVASTTYAQGTYFYHDPGIAFNLWEGNILFRLNNDQLHGTSGLDTAFRNWLNGRDWNTCTYSGGTCTDANNYGHSPTVATNAVELCSYGRGYNLVGNILGTPGYHTIYTTDCSAYSSCTGTPSTATASSSVYLTGFPTTPYGGAAGVPDDALVGQTLMRWGNYDVVNAAVRWNSAESSPAASTYINAQSTPSSETLANSWYLTATTSSNCNSGISWWHNPTYGCIPFPPIGPDVTGGTGSFFSSGTYAGGICIAGMSAGGATCPSSGAYNVGGYADPNPAMACYFETMSGPGDGSGSVLSFDANSCYYASGTTPAPPTNLVATPH